MWSPARHRFTLRQTVSTMEKADSMTFVLARVRRNCAGTQVYALRYREEWLKKIPHAGVRRRAELLYQQLDALQGLRRTLRPELLAESRKHKPVKLLRQIPCIGPIRAARLMALMQTRIGSVANGSSGLIVGWALRHTRVRNIATSADNCTVSKNPNRFVVSIRITTMR